MVDNASTDSTADVLRKFQLLASFPVTVATEPVPGLGRAHNRGWQMAKGEIVAFTDDDCYLTPPFLDETLKVFADPKIGYCSGRILLYDMSDHPITTNDSTVPEVYPPYSYISGGLQGANMAFRRKVLEDIEGFDNAFGPGTPFNCEDIDAFARASFAGWWGAYNPGPTVFHAHGRKAVDAVKLWRNYQIGRGARMAKFILRSDTRRKYLRHWFLPLPKRLINAGRRQDSLYEILGALRYCYHRTRVLCAICYRRRAE